ncbi:exosortase E/protease, VPEID-CTERM system [Paludibaculum fermentans]|uniref:exosortase E/protease, VPEID-CTERM system n=1 Tax=Paludibaculum fermentans TaxID=1473598 RepID=UPI003EBB76E1
MPSPSPAIPPPLHRQIPGTALVPPAGFRFLALVALLGAELLAASISLDAADLPAAGGLATWVRHLGPMLVRSAVAFLATAFMLSQQGPSGLRSVLLEAPGRVRFSLLAAHAALMALFSWLSPQVFAGVSASVPGWLTLAWLVSGLAGVGLLALSLLPISIWLGLIRAVGWGWAWGLAVAGVAAAARPSALATWRGSSALTFKVVRFLLEPILPGLTANPATADIGTSRFSVIIDPACSGYEGVGLFLAFSVAWLYLFRREYRFPAALCLIPAGALVMWILNAVRIAVLILIGHAGADRIAMGGFHSEAGWIAFLFTAILFCVLSRRIALFRHPSLRLERPPTEDTANATAVSAYLMPFLAILAASILARAGSADFEWLYPLRLLAAVAALWYFRKSYGQVDWRFGPVAALAGLAVAALWAWSTPSAAAARAGLPAGFVAMPWALQAFWLACRTLAAVVTVPIAEELAFRGYLMRRLADADFESVDWRKFAWLPFLGSSLAFGAMHESRWLAGLVAGAVYALVQMRRGRLGDAILAHAVTNAALAALVWYTGDWRYW